MDINVFKSELVKALYITQNIVERKTTMPILGNLLLSGTEGRFHISATDLETAAVSSVPAKINSGGSTTVNARVFSEIIRELPDTEVNLRLVEGERLEITAEKTRLRVVCVNSEEYPSLPGLGLETTSRVDARQLNEMISKTLYAVSTDETRFNLNGVCFEIISEGSGKKAAKNLKMVATDGHRLAVIQRSLGDFAFKSSGTEGSSNGVICPRKGLAEVKKLLDTDNVADVGIAISEGFLVVQANDFKMAVRLIDGEFPDYKQVIPKTKGVMATIESEAFVHALRRVALIVTDKNKSVKLDFGKKSLKLSSSSPELGDAAEEIEISYAGEPVSVGFNARYLLDFCGSLGEKSSLTVELNGELGPGKFYAQDDESYFAIVMPMRLAQ